MNDVRHTKKHFYLKKIACFENVWGNTEDSIVFYFILLHWGTDDKQMEFKSLPNIGQGSSSL